MSSIADRCAPVTASLPAGARLRLPGDGVGSLTPVQGALIQEAIDVAVILNAQPALKS